MSHLIFDTDLQKHLSKKTKLTMGKNFKKTKNHPQSYIVLPSLSWQSVKNL